jgi:uncharacterized protein (DUF1778 family)
MPRKREANGRTISIRASSRQIGLIDRAAALKGISRSEFMLEAATQVAEDAVHDSSVFSMPPDEWDAYIATLASPPGPTESLRNLLREPAPWE